MSRWRMRVGPRAWRLWVPALGLVVAVAGLCGCGDSAPTENGVGARTPAEIVAAAQSAAEGAATVHVKGSIVEQGKPIAMDVKLVADKGGKGVLVDDGRTVEVVNVDTDIYINADQAFYRRALGEAPARLLAGRWLKASQASGDLNALASVTSLGRLTHIALSEHAPLTGARRTVLGGKPAVAVSDASGGTLYVSAIGTPYPLEIEKRGGSEISFDGWDKPVTLSVPEGSVNLKRVQSGR